MKIKNTKIVEKLPTKKDGYYECSYCGVIQHLEEEIKCWECGKGDMCWVNSLDESLKKDPRGQDI